MMCSIRVLVLSSTLNNTRVTDRIFRRKVSSPHFFEDITENIFDLVLPPLVWLVGEMPGDHGLQSVRPLLLSDVKLHGERFREVVSKARHFTG